jgi:hypothetical protein
MFHVIIRTYQILFLLKVIVYIHVSVSGSVIIETGYKRPNIVGD